MYKVVIMRHGESLYNVLNRCAGWLDCDLTPDGITQARKAGKTLRESGFIFDLAYCSQLKRAKETLSHVLEEMSLSEIPIQRSWRLNERHYGALDDLTRDEAELKFGRETLRRCREDFWFSPPSVKTIDVLHSYQEPYDVRAMDSESMHNATTRCLTYWNNVILPSVSDGLRVVIVAHGEILRLLTGYLIGLNQDKIIHATILPNASPMVIELNDVFKVTDYYHTTKIKDLV